MSENVTSKSIEQLMAEADELVKRIDADAIKNMEEEHRLQVEIHTQHLKKIKSAVQDKIKKKGTPKMDHGAEDACARTAAISPDGRTIVSTTMGPTHNVMAVIDRTENKVVEKWTADSFVCDMQFSLDGRYLVAATSRGVFIFDTTNWKKTKLTKLIAAGGN